MIKLINYKEKEEIIKQIENNMSILDNHIKDIMTKNNEIQNFISILGKKSNLYDSEKNIQLKLQLSLLNNEKDHITHMKKIFITNMFNELYELSNNIILLISSFLNLDFKDNSNTSDILKKLVRIKQLTVVKITDIFESVTAICKNLNLICENLNEFNDYIETMGSNIKDNNYHCSNIYTTLKHKHNYIELEYTKYYNTLSNIIPYYKLLSDKIHNQMKDKQVLFYCLNNEFLHSKKNDITIIENNENAKTEKGLIDTDKIKIEDLLKVKNHLLKEKKLLEKQNTIKDVDNIEKTGNNNNNNDKVQITNNKKDSNEKTKSVRNKFPSKPTGAFKSVVNKVMNANKL